MSRIIKNSHSNMTLHKLLAGKRQVTVQHLKTDTHAANSEGNCLPRIGFIVLTVSVTANPYYFNVTHLAAPPLAAKYSPITTW